MNLREIKARAKSVTETLKITKAMKLISTSKLRRARTLLESTITYFERIMTMMELAVTHAETVNSRFFKVNTDDANRKTALVLITSDKGLAGGFNINVIRKAESVTVPNTFFMIVGNVGKRYFMARNRPVLEDFRYHGKIPTVFDAEAIVDFFITQYKKGALDEVSVVFTRMKSSVKLEPEILKLLPFDRDEMLKRAPEGGDKYLYSMTPDPETVFDALVPRYLVGVIYGAMVESYASEQAARMQAMDSASKNAEEMIHKMNLAYNRARQQIITQEVSEIVAGAAALGG